MQPGQGDGFEAPGGEDEQAAVPFTPDPEPARSPIDAVLERNTPMLRRIDGVVGCGRGQTPVGDDAVRVDVRDASVQDRLPADLEGFPVVVVVTGPMDALGQGEAPP